MKLFPRSIAGLTAFALGAFALCMGIYGLLDPAAVKQLLDAHYERRENNGNRIWNLYMFQVWWDLYQERSGA